MISTHKERDKEHDRKPIDSISPYARVRNQPDVLWLIHQAGADQYQNLWEDEASKDDRACLERLRGESFIVKQKAEQEAVEEKENKFRADS